MRRYNIAEIFKKQTDEMFRRQRLSGANESVIVSGPSGEDPEIRDVTVDEFLGLKDAPSSYAGRAGKVLVVNPTSDGLAFATSPSFDLLTNGSLTNPELIYIDGEVVWVEV